MVVSTDQRYALEIEGLSAGYEGQDVLHGVSFVLKPGEIACLLGPSGCGKTTLLKTLAGFNTVSAGQVTIGGRLLSSTTVNVSPEHRAIGMVFQDFALFPHFSVNENIAFGLDRLGRQKRKQTVAQLLDLVGLHGFGEQYPHELSGGQQQRVALARALAPEPSLLLLDEPFSSLDAELRGRLSLDIRDILKQRNATALMVTHDQQEAFAMADQVGILKDGVLQQWDSPFNLYHEPANRFVANFIGRGTLLEGVMRSGEAIETELGLLIGNRAYRWPEGHPVDVLLRPDDVVEDRRSSLSARIVGKVFAGSSTLYRLELKSGKRIEILCPSHHDYELNESLPIRVQADHLIAFERHETV
ncbi:ABC transporter ATP-binding protein [Allohahella sp. A8]|uniref:ABC transporter ATP-binding protein n=1 Tax=Allohahella sp. A8 TaxID=3141461 RepID=UPI000C0A60B1|nr:iron ABC transporter ATP-binding protein [Hahellaceae bacterium]|tara:strand:+ start:11595 stop:12668 length:1074 start_codon:yes stop_codon:yes gene_type:complete